MRSLSAVPRDTDSSEVSTSAAENQGEGREMTAPRPSHHHQAGPMREDEITSLLGYVLQAHLKLHHPEDVQLSYQ